jgi:CRISPR-associated endonuclease Cas3-HD
MGFLAKSNGIDLISHLVEVANVSKNLVMCISDDEKIISSTIAAALFHDIGKCTEGFQKYLRDDTYKTYVPHNIMSASIIYNYLKINCDFDNVLINTIIRAVLYHHPTNFNKIGNETIDIEDLDNITDSDKENINLLVDRLLEVYNGFNFKLKIGKKISSFKQDINFSYFIDGDKKDVLFFIISNIVKFADFIVSSGFDKSRYINGTYPIDIDFVKPQHYDNRFDTQMEYAMKCMNYRLSVFETQTGFGKTLMGIRYLLSNGKKGYWVCPRNTIAEGLYKTITKELNALGLSDKVSVALLLTNEWVYGDSNSDIIVTNIDNFVRPTMKADSNIYSFNMLYCNCIFDEFHEYVDNQALMALFNVMLKSRFACKNSKTLLLSATPIMNFIDSMKDDENFRYFKYDYDPILSKKIIFSYGENIGDDFLNKQNWLISVNTVNKSQEVYTSGIVDDIIHARFTENDLSERLNDMYREHSKDGEMKTSWVATNILSTGIDVSFGNMMVSWPTPERLLQAGGRCNRWGECIEIPKWKLVRDRSDFIEKRGVDAFTDSDFAIKFYNYLTEVFDNESVIELRDLYRARSSFYEREKESYSKLFKSTLKESIKNLRKLSYTYSNKNNNDTNVKYISNKSNLRKDDSLVSFFFKVKDDSNYEFIDEVMMGDSMILNVDILMSDESINYIFKSMKNSVSKYFKNIKQMENLFKKSRMKFWETILSMATCSETPLLISNNYYYNKKIGLYRKK